MADSGVDTSNESSDNPLFDHPDNCTLEFSPPAIPINQAGQAMPVDMGEPHEFVAKMRGRRYCPALAKGARRRHNILSSYECFKLQHAVSTNNTELVEKLLSTGVDPNSSDEYQRSLLHLAACRGYVDVVRILLRHGANPNIKDTHGNTPLHLAACTHHIPVVIELLDAGTDVTSNNRSGITPIQLAQSKLRLIQMRPSAREKFGGTRWLIEEICMIVNMMLKYLKIQKADAGELESVRERLEKVSTREEVDSEVQNLLDSLDSLKLK